MLFAPFLLFKHNIGEVVHSRVSVRVLSPFLTKNVVNGRRLPLYQLPGLFHIHRQADELQQVDISLHCLIRSQNSVLFDVLLPVVFIVLDVDRHLPQHKATFPPPLLGTQQTKGKLNLCFPAFFD